MKKLLLILAATLALSANATGSVDVRGTTYTVDTIFHAKVGPGTTQTQLKLSGGPALDVFYLTVDRTTPGVSIRSVCATDKVAGTMRTSKMAETKSVNGLYYFAGTNADFFTTSGNASNGSSKIGTPTTSTIVDGEIYKTSNSNYQFSIDRENIARVCRLNYYTGTATISEKVTLFKGVNVMSPNNGITIYTPRYWGTANQGEYAGKCNQVTARLVEGDVFTAGSRFRLEVTSTPTTDGDTTIPSDGFVIHGRGTSTTGCNTGAKDFVGALKPGDIVEFNNIILTPDGDAIQPVTVVSGNPKNVGAGETLDTESERTDASARHPRTSIGISQDGTKIIMMVVDGRSGSSVGVTTSMLADLMRYAGAYEAVNLDGGGSSTLYTAALGVRNHTSDGSERAVGNAIFAVLEAPEDNEVAEIAFVDWAKHVPVLGQYRPKMYGYNRYGKLIDTDFTDFQLSCEPALGDITSDGHGMVAANAGTYALTATASNGAKAVIPITVVDGAPIEATLPNVLLNATRKWDVQLHSVVDGDALEVSPAAFKWSSSDVAIATVTEDGTVQGVADGTCTITGVRGDISVSVSVTVEVPKNTYQHIEAVPTTENWSTSKISATIKGFEARADHSYGLDFTLTSTRGPKVTITNKIKMWSHPEALCVTIDPGETSLTTISADLIANNADRNVKIDRKFESGVSEYEFPLAEVFDLNDVAVYPIEFRSLAIVPTGKVSVPYHVDFKAIRARYNESTVDAVLDLRADTPDECPFVLDGDRTVRLTNRADNVTVTDLTGRVIVNAADTDAVTLPDNGIYVISATIADTTHTAKIRL